VLLYSKLVGVRLTVYVYRLRYYLLNAGFRLPGEAQRIERLLCVFSRCFYEDNACDREACPLGSQDAVLLIVYATIILNTDLHRVRPGHRQVKRMSKNEFVSNLIQVEPVETVETVFLENLYDSVSQDPIVGAEAPELKHATKGGLCPAMGLLNAVNEVQTLDAILRGLAPFATPFQTVEQVMAKDFRLQQNLIYDLSRKFAARFCHLWYVSAERGFCAALKDPGTFQVSLDILECALTLTICTSLTIQHERLAGLFMSFKEFCNTEVNTASAATVGLRDESLSMDLKEAPLMTGAAKHRLLTRVNHCIQEMRMASSTKLRRMKELHEAVRELPNWTELTANPSRRFLMKGDLVKKSARSVTYRLILCSDVLLYTRKSANGFKVCGDISMNHLRIVDWFPISNPSRNLMFSLHHPQKSLTLLCSSEKERKNWVKAIREALRTGTSGIKH